MSLPRPFSVGHEVHVDATDLSRASLGRGQWLTDEGHLKDIYGFVELLTGGSWPHEKYWDNFGCGVMNGMWTRSLTRYPSSRARSPPQGPCLPRSKPTQEHHAAPWPGRLERNQALLMVAYFTGASVKATEHLLI